MDDGDALLTTLTITILAVGAILLILWFVVMVTTPRPEKPPTFQAVCDPVHQVGAWWEQTHQYGVRMTDAEYQKWCE